MIDCYMSLTVPYAVELARRCENEVPGGVKWIEECLPPADPQQPEAKKMAKKLKKGSFDLTDLRNQFQQMNKMGGLQGLMSMLPGAGQMKKQMAAAGMDERKIKHQIAIIDSMTVQERRNPKIIKASRRKRVAVGSGTSVQEVNKLLKQHKQISSMMKKAGKMGKRGLMGAMGGGMMPPIPGGPRFG